MAFRADTKSGVDAMKQADFINVLKETEKQLLEISGCLTVCDGCDTCEDRDIFLSIARAQVITVIHGLQNIYSSLEKYPVIEEATAKDFEEYDAAFARYVKSKGVMQ